MTKLLQSLLMPYLTLGVAPAGGGTPDLGNDHVATEDDTPAGDKPVDKPVEKAAAADEDKPVDKPKARADGGKDELTDEDKAESKYIPRERFNEINRKAKVREEAYQNEVAALRQKIDENKVDANIEAVDKRIAELDEKYDDHMMDGEKDKAKAVRAERRELEKTRGQMVSYAYSAQAQLAAIEQYRFDNALDQVEELYSVLKEGSEDFDQAVTAEISDLMQVYQGRGDSKAVALKKAVQARLGPPPVKGGAPGEEKPTGSALKQERAVDARKRAADTIGKQPPDLNKVGLDSDKLGGGAPKGKDLLKMSQDQFAKLDEDTLKRLRGDEFAGEAA